MACSRWMTMALASWWLAAGCTGWIEEPDGGTTDAGVDPGDDAGSQGDSDTNPCDGIDCSGHGHCVLDGEQARCVCDAGYHPEGFACVESDNPCDGVDCSGHGTCQVNDDQATCVCDAGYHAEGLACVEDPGPCDGVDCSGHGTCQESGGQASCACDAGYHPEGLNCVKDDDPCDGQACSGHGTCLRWDDGPVCACDEGYTPSTREGLDCVPVAEVCVGGPVDYDVDNDGQNDDWFEPNEWECWMYELVNRTRATHDDEGTPECHKPLSWSVEWSAHGRNHSIQMREQGGLFHADFPYAQNCAYGCDPPCEMDMYMNGRGEGHCPPLSHHCNIMRCDTSHVGIGFADTFNTQNFY